MAIDTLTSSKWTSKVRSHSHFLHTHFTSAFTGSEHAVIPDIMSVDKPIVSLILIELHGEVYNHTKLIEQFAKARYMLFSYEVNGYSIIACEYSFIYLSCMQSCGISDVLHRLFNVSRRK